MIGGFAAGARRWWVVVLVGSLGLACTQRRRTYCELYAEEVSECCPGHEYGHLRVICDQDFNNARGTGGGCWQAVRDLYDCGQANACEDACGEVSPDPCAREQQVLLGACSQTPPAPEL